MGIFSDTCPKCGASVKKGAQVCSQCGEPAPGGVTACPRCGKDVWTSSNFCPICTLNLKEYSMPSVAENRWFREAEEFAVRFEAGFKPRVIVEAGTLALLLQGGKKVDILEPGTYPIDSLLRRLSPFDFQRAIPTTIALMDNGDVRLNFPFEEEKGFYFYTAERLKVGLQCLIVFHLQEPLLFFENRLKSRPKIKLTDLEDFLRPELSNTLQYQLKDFKIEDLYGNPQLKEALENRLYKDLRLTLERSGLALIQLSSIEFKGRALEEIASIRSKEKHIEILDIKVHQEQMERDTLARDKIGQVKTDKEVEDAILQIEHEQIIKKHIRKEELTKLELGIERLMFLEKEKLTTELVEIQLKRRALEVQSQLDEKEKEALLGFKLAEQALVLKQKKMEMEIKMKENLAKIVKESVQSLPTTAVREDLNRVLMMVVDEATAERLLKYEEIAIRKELSPEQLLAMAAKESPQAAMALVEKYKISISEEIVKIQEAMRTEFRQLAEKAMEQMGQVAQTRARPDSPQHTVVAGSGLGTPVVIGTTSSQTQEVIICPQCKAKNPPSNKHCSQCGTRLS